jgi:hypothetical protein
VKLDLNLNSVKDAIEGLALDVWEDLGRTRLAGVAVGLTLALLTITALAMRPGGGTEVAESSPVVALASADDVTFTLPRDEPLTMADVDLSAPRDPFRSLGSVAESNQTLLAAGEEIIDSVMAVESGGSSAGLSPETSSLMPLDDLSTTPATTPSDMPQGDFGDSHEPADAEPVPATDYSYTADVQFGQVDDLQRYATVQRLGLIPGRKLPLIMYLGVSTDHETAVFMVDSRLSQGGEGTCVPKDTLCTFLELKPTPSQDEHHFMDADGNEYLLRLRALNRTTTSSGSLSGRSVSALSDSPTVVDGER